MAPRAPIAWGIMNSREGLLDLPRVLSKSTRVSSFFVVQPCDSTRELEVVETDATR